MAPPTYETFELLIGSKRTRGYRTRIINSPAGEANALCRLDIDDHELQEMLADIVDGYSDTELLKEFGHYLFSRLFTGKVKRLYRDSLARVQAQDKRLRVRLRIEAPELAALPWEYLYDEETDQFLAISAHSALMRYIPMEVSKRPSAVKPPLRILVLISDPIDYDKLDVEQEKERIEQALAQLVKKGVVELQVLERAHLATVRHAIHRFSPHVFHYIGHSSSSQLLSGLAANLLKHELSATATYKPGYARMGPGWTRQGDTSTLGEDWAAPLAHELGHYLFFLEDNYIGMDSTGALISIEGCHGAMVNPYTEAESEFYPINATWDSECALTLSNLLTGRSDWESISTFYPTLAAPQVSFSEVYTGPNSLPLDVTQIQQIVPNTPSTTLTDAWFNVIEPDGSTLATDDNQARSILFQGSTDSLIDLGGPIEGRFLARGVRAGVNDRLCVFDLDVTPPRLGCEAVTLNDRRLGLNELPATWTPHVLIDPNSITDFNVYVRNLPTGLTLQLRLLRLRDTSASAVTHRRHAFTIDLGLLYTLDGLKESKA